MITRSMPSFRLHKPPILLSVLLMLACFLQGTASTFSRLDIHHSNASAAKRSARDCEYEGIRSSSAFKQRAVVSALLRVRSGGLGALSTKHSSTTIKHVEDEKDESLDDAKQALQSMRFCYKMCFASVLADLITTLIDGTIRPKYFGTTASKLSWVDAVGVFSSLNPVVFGGGLWYITQLYYKSFLRSKNDFDRKMSQENLMTLFRIKAWVWGLVALNLALVSLSLGAALPRLGKNGPFHFLCNMVTSKQSTMAVTGILGIGGILIRRKCGNQAREEFRRYKEKNGIQELDLRPKLDVIRASGLQAYCNQALCAGSFGVMGVLQLVKWIASFNGNLIGHSMLVFDFLTPFTISLLMFRLNKALLSASASEIMVDPTKADHHDGSIHELCTAGTGFYKKVGKTLRSAAMFYLLPYIALPAAPFVLKVLKKKPFFEKAIDRLGIEIM